MGEPSRTVSGVEPERATRVRWSVLGLLVLLSFVAYVLRTNMSVAGDAIMGEFGLSQVQFGFVLAAFAWSYALFQFPGGVFGDLVGGRRALTWIALAWGAVTLLSGLGPRAEVTGPLVALGALIGLRFLLGVVQAPLFPILGDVVGDWFPPGGRALPNGLSSSGLTLGAAAAGPLIAWLTVTYGWRASFLISAPLGFAAALLWWWWARDRPAEHPAVNTPERELIDRGRDAERRSERIPAAGAWRIVLRDRNVRLLTGSYFCMNYVFYIFFNWFFVYLVQVRGFGMLESGFLATLPWLVGALGASAGGLWCDRLTKSRGIVLGCRIPGVASLALLVVLLIAGAAADNAYLAVALLSICFGCTQLTEGAYWAAVTAVAGRHTAAAAGLMNTGGNAVGGVGALLVPLVAAKLGWIAALSTGSLFALVGALLWLLIRPDRPLEASPD
jgi:ACS family glucarate transporter-like MFS transporter